MKDKFKENLLINGFQPIYSNHNNSEIDYIRDGVRIRYNTEEQSAVVIKDIINRTISFSMTSIKYSVDDWSEIMDMHNLFRKDI